MAHNWIKIFGNEQIDYSYIDYKCSICNLQSFKFKNEDEYNLYLGRNNIDVNYFNTLDSIDDLTCEEFIIKNIIE